MSDSVTLAQLPYTGFDYGSIYNSLFWVVLVVFSFIVAHFVIKIGLATVGKKVTKRRVVAAVKQRELLENPPEPVILEERVVRYDPVLGNSSPVSTKPATSVNILAAAPSSLAPEVQDESTIERVQDIVERELVESRKGQTPDEFSDEDFATTDFDGVNPDVYWQPKEVVKESRQTPQEVQVTKEPVPIVEQVPAVAKVTESAPTVPTVKKEYTDSIALDSSGEFPKVVLTRSES